MRQFLQSVLACVTKLGRGPSAMRRDRHIRPCVEAMEERLALSTTALPHAGGAGEKVALLLYIHSPGAHVRHRPVAHGHRNQHGLASLGNLPNQGATSYPGFNGGVALGSALLPNQDAVSVKPLGAYPNPDGGGVNPYDPFGPVSKPASQDQTPFALPNGDEVSFRPIINLP
jgi:hypothetical protein